MGSWDDPRYRYREQSQIKHIILEKYLERFARIVGKLWDVNYIDGFSGPWNAQAEDLADTSFAIALRELRSARETVAQVHGRTLRLRCLFLEEDGQAFRKLQQYATEQAQSSGVEVVTYNQQFESAIPQIEEFVSRGGPRSFSFLFIDPTGWTGFSMQLIRPLLRLPRTEVLINFMSSFILRFIEAENQGLEDGFERLFGDRSYRTITSGLEGTSREDALVFAYANRLAEVGGFPHVLVTVIPHPQKDRTHFHLIYATRNLRGIEAFKDAEAAALKATVQIRANAKRRAREEKTGQAELFGGEDLPETDFHEELASRYRSQAWRTTSELIRTRRSLSYDEVYAVAMRFPFVTEKDLRLWISQIADVKGLAAGERVPKVGAGHRIELPPPKE